MLLNYSVIFVQLKILKVLILIELSQNFQTIHLDQQKVLWLVPFHKLENVDCLRKQLFLIL
ncbi:MAG: hypothetical protein CMF74_16735 [Maricaulis sp.]|nr:hypothetical protein [Marinobacter sp.]MAL11295.1 hypothetical protein [Maricaulis sp.]